MYYQNLITIQECSKKWLKMKNNKSFLKHLVLVLAHGHIYIHRWLSTVGGGGIYTTHIAAFPDLQNNMDSSVWLI